MFIELKNVEKIYKSGEVETVALKNISLKIEKEEFVAIIGPSGSGKSTLMHIIGCLDRPSSGQYFFDGKDVSKLTDEELAEIRNKKIGFVFQQFFLLPRLNVFKNVMLPLVYAGISKEQREELVKKSLEASAFPEKFYFYRINKISGGMQQRVAIARALVNEPSLILADEPTGNLDSKTGEEVMKTFVNLNKQGKTIILITHELYIAKMAQRIISIKDGQIINDEKNKKNHFLEETRE